MKLSSLRRKAKTEEAPAPVVKPMKALTERMVWEAPANYNRATRRWAKLWGRIWKWDQTALGIAQVPPRYVRRHYTEGVIMAPKTRRQRRHKARILRAMKAGM